MDYHIESHMAHHTDYLEKQLITYNDNQYTYDGP